RFHLHPQGRDGYSGGVSNSFRSGNPRSSSNRPIRGGSRLPGGIAMPPLLGLLRSVHFFVDLFAFRPRDPAVSYHSPPAPVVYGAAVSRPGADAAGAGQSSDSHRPDDGSGPEPPLVEEMVMNLP